MHSSKKNKSIPQIETIAPRVVSHEVDSGIYQHIENYCGNNSAYPLCLEAPPNEPSFYAKFDWSEIYEDSDPSILLKLGAVASELRKAARQLLDSIREGVNRSLVDQMKEFAANILRPHLAAPNERPDWGIRVMVDLESGAKWYQADPEMPIIAHHAGRLLLDISEFHREPMGESRYIFAILLGINYEKLKVRQTEHLALIGKAHQAAIKQRGKTKSENATVIRSGLQAKVDEVIESQVKAGKSPNYEDAVVTVSVQMKVSVSTVKRHTKNPYSQGKPGRKPGKRKLKK